MTQHKSVEAGFTPGPWEFDDSDAERCVVLQPSFMAWHIAYTAGAFERPQEEANAHLIAAAPALYKELDSLRSLVGIMFGQGPDCILPETVGTPLGVPIQLGAMMRDTDAALSSARGNQS